MKFGRTLSPIIIGFMLWLAVPHLGCGQRSPLVTESVAPVIEETSPSITIDEGKVIFTAVRCDFAVPQNNRLILYLNNYDVRDQNLQASVPVGSISLGIEVSTGGTPIPLNSGGRV